MGIREWSVLDKENLTLWPILVQAWWYLLDRYKTQKYMYKNKHKYKTKNIRTTSLPVFKYSSDFASYEAVIA